MGPTATGKTDLAIEMAQKYPIEIISVDSAMIYRTMDIGTGKPNAEILKTIPHHLIDICDPTEAYSAADFLTDTVKHIDAIHQQKKIPILVGGTMLYFKALREGLAVLPTSDAAIRKELQAQANNEGLAKLHEELQRIDPVSAARIHPNDPQRLLRALEVHAISGRTLTDFLNDKTHTLLPYSMQQIALIADNRAALHQKIADRFLQMLNDGFIQEVEQLKQRSDLHADLPSTRCVGYRQIWDYLAGAYTHAEMVERSIIATRQLAKRQLTWLRSFDNLQIYDFQQTDLKQKISDLIERIM